MSNRSAAPSRKVETDASGSWASIASSQQKADAQVTSSGWDAPVSSTNDISWSEAPAPITTTTTIASQQPSITTASTEPATTKPSSWASLLK